MIEITKKSLKQELDKFSKEQLKQVAYFIAFIKFQTKLNQENPDISQFASLYQEFEKEDRELAETGISEYAKLLNSEDRDASKTW